MYVYDVSVGIGSADCFLKYLPIFRNIFQYFSKNVVWRKSYVPSAGVCSSPVSSADSSEPTEMKLDGRLLPGECVNDTSWTILSCCLVVFSSDRRRSFSSSRSCTIRCEGQKETYKSNVPFLKTRIYESFVMRKCEKNPTHRRQWFSSSRPSNPHHILNYMKNEFL